VLRDRFNNGLSTGNIINMITTVQGNLTQAQAQNAWQRTVKKKAQASGKVSRAVWGCTSINSPSLAGIITCAVLADYWRSESAGHNVEAKCRSLARSRSALARPADKHVQQAASPECRYSLYGTRAPHELCRSSAVTLNKDDEGDGDWGSH
jgi:hypothetical protein